MPPFSFPPWRLEAAAPTRYTPDMFPGQILIALTVFTVWPQLASATPPELLDDRYELTLFAEHPQVRTPVGCAIDHSGRLLVVESHTHFRPKGYEGPKTDRILALSDTTGDGRADLIDTHFEGGTHMMSIVRGLDRRLFVATRSEIFSLEDTTPDGKADERVSLVKLETTGDYPHNGLGGLTFAGDDYLYFGLGENLGHPYKLVPQNRRQPALEGGGEGGNIYRISIRAGELERVATGFWNPFGICIDRHGRMFAVDNDPDSSPPNRLLHIVAGGDYGYQFRYGRSGKHPLQAWNGELPGTLPMVAGTGEAASAVLPVGDDLWVTSWGHNRIESYTLKARGLSYSAAMKTVVKGDQNFRPVDFAHAPDGSIYFTDWVDKSYPLHNKGRVWKLTPKTADVPRPVMGGPWEEDPNLRHPPKMRAKALADGDPFALASQAWQISLSSKPAAHPWDKQTELRKIAIVSSIRWEKWPTWETFLKRALDDPSPAVRLAGVRIVADFGLESHAAKLAEMVPDALEHGRLFDAIVAALKHLGADSAKFDREQILLAVANDPSKPADQRARALAGISPDSKKLTIAEFQKLIASEEAALRDAAVWHLTQRSKKDAGPVLQSLLEDGDTDPELRRDIAANISDNGAAPTANPRRDLETWLAKLKAMDGDPRAGRRVFFSDKLGMCARCHTHGGYGTAVGPDLTQIGADGDLKRLLESILNPNREIGPSYVAEMIETADGKLNVGIPTLVTGRHGTGAEVFVGVDGKPFEVPLAEMKSRSPWVASLMPEGLDVRFDTQQMRDLIAFLRTSP